MATMLICSLVVQLKAASIFEVFYEFLFWEYYNESQTSKSQQQLCHLPLCHPHSCLL